MPFLCHAESDTRTRIIRVDNEDYIFGIVDEFLEKGKKRKRKRKNCAIKFTKQKEKYIQLFFEIIAREEDIICYSKLFSKNLKSH